MNQLKKNIETQLVREKRRGKLKALTTDKMNQSMRKREREEPRKHRGKLGSTNNRFLKQKLSNMIEQWNDRTFKSQKHNWHRQEYARSQKKLRKLHKKSSIVPQGKKGKNMRKKASKNDLRANHINLKSKTVMILNAKQAGPNAGKWGKIMNFKLKKTFHANQQLDEEARGHLLNFKLGSINEPNKKKTLFSAKQQPFFKNTYDKIDSKNLYSSINEIRAVGEGRRLSRKTGRNSKSKKIKHRQKFMRKKANILKIKTDNSNLLLYGKPKGGCNSKVQANKASLRIQLRQLKNKMLFSKNKPQVSVNLQPNFRKLTFHNNKKVFPSLYSNS